jgi:hypothetical protein
LLHLPIGVRALLALQDLREVCSILIWYTDTNT